MLVILPATPELKPVPELLTARICSPIYPAAGDEFVKPTAAPPV